MSYIPAASLLPSVYANPSEGVADYWAPESLVSTSAALVSSVSTTSADVSTLQVQVAALEAGVVTGPTLWSVPAWESGYTETQGQVVLNNPISVPASGSYKLALNVTYDMSNAPASGISTTQVQIAKSSDYGSTFTVASYGPVTLLPGVAQGTAWTYTMHTDLPNLLQGPEGQLRLDNNCVGPDAGSNSGATINISATQLSLTSAVQGLSTITTL